MNVLRIKVWLAGIGLVLGLVGMALELQGIIWVAVGCLGAAFLLRFVKRPVRRGEADAQSQRSDV